MQSEGDATRILAIAEAPEPGFVWAGFVRMTARRPDPRDGGLEIRHGEVHADLRLRIVAVHAHPDRRRLKPAAIPSSLGVRPVEHGFEELGRGRDYRGQRDG